MAEYMMRGRGRRSKKAGRPPADGAASPQVKRRRKRAHPAVRKDTTVLQTDRGTKLICAGIRPKVKKV